MSFFPNPAVAAEPANKSFPDAELVLNLSIFGFSRLSASDQREQTEEFCTKVVENVTVVQLSAESEEDFRLRKFSELFKKLPFIEQSEFLSRVITIFKRKRQIGELISWFQKQDASVQERMIGEITDHVPAENLQIPGETEEEFRLRKFVELFEKIPFTKGEYFPWTVIEKFEPERQIGELISWFKKLDASVEERSEKREGEYEGFDEFFLGFSIIWFKGQSAKGQAELTVQLCDGVSKLPDESEDFRLTTFTELCKKADFAKQAKFLSIADWKLRGLRLYPHGRLLQPQDSAGAAELASRLSESNLSCVVAHRKRSSVRELVREFRIVKYPKLNGGGGAATTTQSTQGGQGTSQR